MPPASPQERYDALVASLLSTSDATLSTKKGFGSSALWVDGKIFAMLVRDRLVVKLPRQRVDALVGSGCGKRFEPGPGRVMKEWFTLASGQDDTWLPLATEALQFVSRRRPASE